MLTENELRIFSVFCQKPFATYTRKQIKEAANERSNNTMSRAIQKFTAEELITEQKVGRSSLYTLNLKNKQTTYYLALANQKDLDKTTERTISLIKEHLEKATPFYTLVLFGSYAEGKQRKSSDLDVAIIIEEENKAIERAVAAAILKTPQKIDSHVMTRKEFLEMLQADEENVGKEIARKHKALHNHQIFYAILEEGKKHGFAL